MKLRAIVPNNVDHASTWWRITQPFRYLKEHDCKIIPFEKADDAEIRDCVVFLHRLISDHPKEYIQSLKKRGARKVIYSMDDLTTNEEALKEYLVGIGAMTSIALANILANVPNQIRMIQESDYVVVSTEGLADEVYKDTGRIAQVIPNGLPEDFWFENLASRPMYHGNNDTVYIGWAGGRRPESDLEGMTEAWNRICTDFTNVRFVVGGWQPDIIDRNIDLDRKVRIPWAPFDTWPRTMQVDIGCCPLADTAFNKGKSPIKFFEYTGSGAVVVASPNIYGKVLTSGLSGMLVKDNQSADDWYNMLATLITNKYIRHSMQQMASYDVTNFYSLDATIVDWKIFLGKL
jgi:glycosyltransferase involved in cell wall biosynthesis